MSPQGADAGEAVRPTVAQQCALMQMRLTPKRRAVMALLDLVDSPIDLEQVWWKATEHGVQINRSTLQRLAADLVKAGVLIALAGEGRRIRFMTPIWVPVILQTTEQVVVDDPALSEKLIALLNRHGLSAAGRRIVISLTD